MSGTGFAALPHGCDHIAWTWIPAFDDAGEPNGDDTVAEQYTTWIVEPGGESAERPVRRLELAGQELLMAGEPHHCQTDPDTGRELWAVELSPAG